MTLFAIQNDIVFVSSFPCLLHGWRTRNTTITHTSSTFKLNILMDVENKSTNVTNIMLNASPCINMSIMISVPASEVVPSRLSISDITHGEAASSSHPSQQSIFCYTTPGSQNHAWDGGRHTHLYCFTSHAGWTAFRIQKHEQTHARTPIICLLIVIA
jgi:hypothetical protein